MQNIKIIAVSGKLRHGKDTLTQFILDEIKKQKSDIIVTKIAFADPIKRIAKLIYPMLTEHDLWGPSQNRNRIIEGYKNPKTGEDLIVRDVLTQIGGWGRSTNENCWVNSTFGIIDSITFGNKDKDHFILISDCRFKNELQAIKSRNGKSIRVIRQSVGFTTNDPSEIDLDDVSLDEFSHVIYNDSGLEHLQFKARSIVEKIFIE